MFPILWLNEVQAIDPWAPSALLRVTLVEGPRSKVQWNRAILLDESHKLDPWPLDEGPRPKRDKLRLNLHGTILEGKSIGSNPQQQQKKKVQKESSWFEAPSCKLGSNSRVQFALNEFKLVLRNLDSQPHLKARIMYSLESITP
jgi:hypothetical protein